MRVHLLSSMHCTKLSWHNRKFTCNLRPWGQITLAPARHRLCRRASSKSIQLYRPESCRKVPSYICFFHSTLCLMAERREVTLAHTHTTVIEIILLPLSISSFWLLDLFTVAMSPFHIALYTFRLQMKKTKSAWCKVCATGLVFGFQLNKTHGCHLWVQPVRVLNSKM